MLDWAGRRGAWLLGLFAMVMLAVMVGGELLQNEEPFSWLDLMFELFNAVVVVGTSVVSTLLVIRIAGQEQESRSLRAELALVRAEGRQWRSEMADELRELGKAIRRQFEAWRLTAAEQDVGLLLLKGFSHKEIARLRNTSEATIRQQAASIYLKSKLSGRAALSAYFLEDLLTDPGAQAAIAAPIGGRAA